ncbi:MAG: hypothetical protein PF489_12550 [Salinivirgaceae bacterium]|jgi:hypothetical protein|nr:hypothetical protein [Salinivirgaceae bacterium]
MINFKRFTGSLFIVAVLLLTGCTQNKLKIDISDISTNPELIRFDSILFEPDPNTVAAEANGLYNKYPLFAPIYFEHIIKVGTPYSSEFEDLLGLFLTEYEIRMSYVKGMELYNDFGKYKDNIDRAFKHYRYYFPKKNIPDIYTIISGFNQSIIVADSVLAISLDKFLGSDSRHYDQLQIAKYLRIRMQPEAIPYEALKGWISTEFVFEGDTKNLVSHMIHHGKLLYLMDALFPNSNDQLKIGYSEAEIQWCNKSEDQVWLYLMDKKLLFDGNRMLIKRFIEEAPFTGPFGKNSPGRIGQWIGWNIVRSYMNKNSDVTIPMLMDNYDYQQILLNSGYNP